MAEGAITIYNDLKEQLFLKIHDMDSDVITLTLHTGYTPNIDTHQLRSDVVATEYGSGAGYTAGGQTLDTVTVTQDNTNDRALLDAADEVFTALGPLTPATPSHAIIWNNTPAAPLDPLMFYIELGTTATNGGNYTIAWSSSPAAMVSLT
jgi:hypothetical protein